MTDNDKPNVIPFSINGVAFTDLGPPSDPTTFAASDLIAAIEAQGFEGEAGPLENSTEWIELKRRLNHP